MVTKADILTAVRSSWFEPKSPRPERYFQTNDGYATTFAPLRQRLKAFPRRVEPKPKPVPTENPANGSETVLAHINPFSRNGSWAAPHRVIRILSFALKLIY